MESSETGWRWHDYYEAVSSRPPRDTLLFALDLFERDELPNKLAVDLGCGSGVDTRALLERGWRVFAIDSNPEGIARLIESVPPEHVPFLQTQCAAYENANIPDTDFINASYSLPFGNPASFPMLWSHIIAAIRPGGRFAGQFFGPKDTWAANPKMTNHTHDEVLETLRGFEIEYLQIRDEDGTTALGDAKHWHVFSVVARKREFDLPEMIAQIPPDDLAAYLPQS